MQLTHTSLHAVATKGCGFTNEQMDILGVQRPPNRGWVQRLIGTELPDADYARLLSLKGKKGKNQNAELPAFESYQLPTAPEKRQQTFPESVNMAIPLECVEAVMAIIRLRESISLY